MPRLSRFLFGDWLVAEELTLDEASTTVSAAYRDSQGARHRRRVRLEPGDAWSSTRWLACARQGRAALAHRPGPGRLVLRRRGLERRIALESRSARRRCSPGF